MRISIFSLQLKKGCRERQMEFADGIKLVAEAGVRGLDIDRGEVGSTAANLSLLKEHGIVVNSIIARSDFMHEYDPQFADMLIKDCLSVGADNVLFVPGTWREGDDRMECVKRIVEPLRNMIIKGKENGISIGLEDYTPTESVGKIEELLYLATNIPEMHVIFDTGNFLYLGENVLDAYKVLKPYIKKQVHLKDRAFIGRPEETPEIIDGEAVYPAVVGKGFIPHKEILDDLKASGFNGSITAELFGTGDSMTDILESVKWMKQYGTN